MSFLKTKKPKTAAKNLPHGKVGAGDCAKFDVCESSIDQGRQNYILFQRNAAFHWPLWLESMLDPRQKTFQSPCPCVLVNTAIRDHYPFSNLLSSELLSVDPSGMITVTPGNFSLEFWLIYQGKLYRPQKGKNNIKIFRDPETFCLKVSWVQKDFSVTVDLAGARDTSHEVLMEIETSLSFKRGYNALVMAVRPYTGDALGTLKEISLDPETGIVRANGRAMLVFDKAMDSICYGSGNTGDVKPEKDYGATDTSVRCAEGMASVCVNYTLTEKKDTRHFRILCDSTGDLAPLSFSPGDVKSDFTDFIRMRLGSGMNVEFADHSKNLLLKRLKLSCLQIFEPLRDLLPSVSKPFTMYLTAASLIRMGLFDEASAIAEIQMDMAEKGSWPSLFDEAVAKACALCVSAELFSHMRDIEMLRSRYDSIRIQSESLLKMTTIQGVLQNHRANSISFNLIPEPHVSDLIIFIRAFQCCAYMARCMGIFGEEKRYKDESARLIEHLSRSLKKIDKENINDIFISYIASAAVPWLLSDMNQEIIKDIDEMIGLSGHGASYTPPYGIDVFATLLRGQYFAQTKQPEACRIFDVTGDFFKEIGSTGQFLNPVTGYCSTGSGCHIESIALQLLFLRSLLFIDSEKRLDLFPAPPEDWFKPSGYVRIKNAPSRFGLLNFSFQVSSTEVKFSFDAPPKYIPPDIMINLPYRFRVVQSDDFILKRQNDTSCVINGWPSSVRLKKL